MPGVKETANASKLCAEIVPCRVLRLHCEVSSCGMLTVRIMTSHRAWMRARGGRGSQSRGIASPFSPGIFIAFGSACTAMQARLAVHKHQACNFSHLAQSYHVSRMQASIVHWVQEQPDLHLLLQNLYGSVHFRICKPVHPARKLSLSQRHAQGS